MDFMRRLETAWRANSSLACVGLDPDVSRIPDRFRGTPMPLFEFNKTIVDATADLVCAFKPQIAYYASSGAEKELELTIEYIHESYPGIPVILDAKRGDIGSTAEHYAREAFDRYRCDAVTVNPYMGGDTLKPFLDRADKGVMILCRTSNPGAGEIQDLCTNGEELYRTVARKAALEWNYNGNVLLVVGGTSPEDIKEVRSIVGDMPFLVPGIGAQGGNVGQVVSSGKDRSGAGLIINSSRAVIYAGGGDDFAEAARKAVVTLKDEINLYR